MDDIHSQHYDQLYILHEINYDRAYFEIAQLMKLMRYTTCKSSSCI